MYLFGEVVNAAGIKGIGIVRTAGKKYVPIEDTGYDSKYGFPIRPNKATIKELVRSFARGTLEPAPTKMSIERGVLSKTPEPPYVPGMDVPSENIH